MTGSTFGATEALPVLRCTFGFWTSTSWTDQRELSWPELTEVLTTHKVGQKEGSAIVPATFRGDRRIKSDAEEIDVAFLDSDTGRTLAEIEASVRVCGWAAVISSSYSHLTTQTKVSRSNVEKFRHDNPHGTDADFLVNDKGMLPRVAAGARVAREDDDFVYFEHQPCPKFRVAIRLLRPWLASDYPTQDAANAAWKERIEALAAALGLQHDQSCTDTSRLFYLPRRAANAPPPETCVIDGDPCDLFAIPACVRAGKANGAGLFDGGNGQIPPDADTGEFVDPDTGEVFDLRWWARDYGERFRIAAALRVRKPSMLTGHIADSVKVHCRCPNEARHTEPGADRATFVVNADSFQQWRVRRPLPPRPLHRHGPAVVRPADAGTALALDPQTLPRRTSSCRSRRMNPHRGAKCASRSRTRQRQARVARHRPSRNWSRATPGPSRRRTQAPTRQTTDDWPEPVDFMAAQLGAPILKERHVPPSLWPFISDNAERMGVATSSVALCAIVSCLRRHQRGMEAPTQAQRLGLDRSRRGCGAPSSVRPAC